MYYVPQLSELDCGIACLKMLLAHFNHDERYLFMPVDENHGKYSYRDLEAIGAKNGITLKGFKVLDKTELLSNNKGPVIVRLKTTDKMGHAVVVSKINRRRAHILDPHMGEYNMRLDEFFTKWDSTGLFVSEFNKTPYPYNPIEPLPKKSRFLAFGLQVLSGISFAIGVYFMNPTGSYILSLTFLFIGILFELLLRLYLYKLMDKVDDYFIKNYDLVDSTNYYEYYIRSQEFKKRYLTYGFSLIYSVLVSIFMIVITIFNNPYNFPLVIAPIALSAIEVLSFNKKEERDEKLLAIQEECLKENDSQTHMIMKVKKLTKHAYDFSKQVLLKRYLGIILFFLMSILVAVLTKSFTLIEIIFSICIEYFIYQNLLPVFSLEQRRQEIVVSKAKLNNILESSVHHLDENI